LVSIVSTGLSEMNRSENDISVYPNPSNGLYVIKSNFKLNAEVTDLTGKRVLSITNANEIDLSSQAKGIYLLNLYSRSGQLLKIIKLVKQ
jgi:hypothetical protein